MFSYLNEGSARLSNLSSKFLRLVDSSTSNCDSRNDLGSFTSNWFDDLKTACRSLIPSISIQLSASMATAKAFDNDKDCLDPFFQKILIGVVSNLLL
jgi:hypothetical protein